MLKAIILDVDGTLYCQRTLRRALLFRLARAHLRNPSQGLVVFRALRAYRRAQEWLRQRPDACDHDISEAQISLACQATGIATDTMQSVVRHWFEQEPLRFLRQAVFQGVEDFLAEARRNGLLTGVCSDYPALPKLQAMGLSDCFDVVVTAQDSDVQRFKPDARGLEVALRRLGVTAQCAAYVGNRPETDAIAALRAGMTPVILRRRRSAKAGDWIQVRDYFQLARILNERNQVR